MKLICGEMERLGKQSGSFSALAGKVNIDLNVRSRHGTREASRPGTSPGKE